MAETKNDELPEWLVYGADGELDVTATLKSLPEVLDKTLFFFREVPEWFEAGPENLDEIREGLAGFERAPAEERKKYPQEAVEKMKRNMKRMIACNEMMAAPGLSGNQKEVLRCICYWISLETMNSVPLTPEEEEELF